MTNNSRPARPTTCIDCSTALTKASRASSHGLGADYDDICISCYDYAGWENTHQDEAHEAPGSLPDPNCPVCAKGSQIAAAALAPRAGRAHGVHINHTACYAKGLHDKTRDGRQACRDAELFKQA